MQPGGWLIWAVAGAAVPVAAFAFWLWGTGSAGYLVDLIAAYCF